MEHTSVLLKPHLVRINVIHILKQKNHWSWSFSMEIMRPKRNRFWIFFETVIYSFDILFSTERRIDGFYSRLSFTELSFIFSSVRGFLQRVGIKFIYTSNNGLFMNDYVCHKNYEVVYKLPQIPDWFSQRDFSFWIIW